MRCEWCICWVPFAHDSDDDATDEFKVLNHEVTADRIVGNGGGSAAESSCDETANCQKHCIFLENAFWSLSPGPHQLQSAVEHRGVPMVIKSHVPAVERRMPNIVRHSAVVTCE